MRFAAFVAIFFYTHKIRRVLCFHYSFLISYIYKGIVKQLKTKHHINTMA